MLGGARANYLAVGQIYLRANPLLREPLKLEQHIKPYFVRGRHPASMHRTMAATHDAVCADIRQIRHEARAGRSGSRPAWPMIVLESPKGWTGPVSVDGKPVEGTFRAPQVPLPVSAAARSTSRHWRPGCAAIGHTICSTSMAGCAPSCANSHHAGPGA